MRYSILIPAYNEELYLANCIDSILRTDYDDLEIIVYDDGSNDNTYNIAKEYSGKHDNIHIIGTGKNRGRSYGMNIMLSHAEGDIILKLDADMEIISRDIFEILDRTFSDSKVGGVAIFGHTAKIHKEQSGIALGEYVVYELVNEIKKEMLPISSLKELKYPLDIHCMRRKLITSFPHEIIHDDGYMAMEVLDREYQIVHAEGIIIHHLKPPATREQLIRVRTRGMEGWKQLSQLYNLKFDDYEHKLINKFISNINKYNKKEMVGVLKWLSAYLSIKITV